MAKFNMLLLALVMSIVANAQVTISQLSVPYSQNFNSLSDTSLSNPYSTLPTGWFAQEVGSNADQTYRAAWGQYSGGDLYSFGDSASTERALGSIGSGTNSEVYYGVAIVNNTGGTVQNVRVNYTGEQWRVGNPARSTGPDTIHFSYGVNTGGINAGSWTSAANLSFYALSTTSSPSNVEVDGNSNTYKQAINDTLYNVNLGNGDTLWIRWFDYNSSSFDDGLSVDDLSVTFLQGTTGGNFLSFNAMNTYYYENFDNLGSTQGATVSFSTLPTGWFAYENGGNADQTYRAAYGDYAGGNTYSFGDTNSTERALGSIGSGSVDISHYGSAWINNTGQVVNNVEIKFTGEMWRQGRPGRGTGPDTLHFSYAKNAVSIDSGSYIGFSSINFFSPITNGTLNTPIDGNLPAHQTVVNGVIANLSLQQGDTLWIRWTDYNSDSYDDGLAIDSFSIAAVNAPALLNMEFASDSHTFSEAAGNVQVPLYIHNKSTFLSQVEVFIADSGTIHVPSDLTISSGYVSFPGNKTDTVAYFNFGIKNTQPFEADEYFVLGIRNAINGVLGQTMYDTIHIQNYQYPQIPISKLSGDDAQGYPDSADKVYVIEGTVHGVNYSATNGLDFYIIENGSGINIYEATMTATSYQPKAGDKVKVWGQVGYFRGLTRMEAIDSIELVSSSNTLETPTIVTSITEPNESAYLQLDSLRLYPALSIWPNNLEVYAVQAGTNDTIAIYVSAQTDLAGKTAPNGYFSIIGIGSQFTSSTNPPFVDGYRLMAVSESLVIPVSVDKIGNSTVSAGLKLYPNPVADQVTIEGTEVLNEVSVYTLEGKCIWKQNTNTQKVTITTASWNTGVYILRASDSGNQYINKIIKL